MTRQLVLVLYKTLIKELYRINNKNSIEIVKMYVKENKNIINEEKINIEIQRMIGQLIYLHKLK